MNTRAERIEAARLAQLRAFVPGLFAAGTLLYIGASIRRAQCLVDLVAAGRRVTILEAWPANAEHYRGRPGLEVVRGDVRALASLSLPAEIYDAAFWWHGPEHVARAELATVLAGIERRARLVVLGCPWGVYPQSAIEGNRYEQHVAVLGPQDFGALGYRVATLGRAGDRADSNVLAVKP